MGLLYDHSMIYFIGGKGGKEDIKLLKIPPGQIKI